MLMLSWKSVKNLSHEDLIFGSVLIAFTYAVTRVMNSIFSRVLHWRSEYNHLTHFSGDKEISYSSLKNFLNDVISIITIAYPFLTMTTVILLILIAISYLHQRKLEERISQLKNRISVSDSRSKC